MRTLYVSVTSYRDKASNFREDFRLRLRDPLPQNCCDQRQRQASSIAQPTLASTAVGQRPLRCKEVDLYADHPNRTYFGEMETISNNHPILRPSDPPTDTLCDPPTLLLPLAAYEYSCYLSPNLIACAGNKPRFHLCMPLVMPETE
jgi:hypothetical protein